MPARRAILRHSPDRSFVCPSSKPYWYDDGDALLVVQDHVFMLKQRILSCSEVFRDMFAFACPSPEELLEGCVVIHLTDDPRDWMLLLLRLDDSDNKFWEKDDLSYENIASLLRLATKYEIPEVREHTITKLHELWPSPARLEAMDEDAFSPYRADAISLAMQCDLPEILPAIFYSLAVDYIHTTGLVLPGRLTDPADQLRLVVGAARLEGFNANALQRAQALGCCAACKACITERWKALLGRTWTLRAMYWDWAEIDAGAWEGLCMDCFCLHESFLEMTRAHLRDAIPGFFGL
ncbi:hypothetical protein B0F90DRAFT_1818300 [Multifurca ochricompacta]|uniref:BTB domain-containing protein n=1 Tax=Multifurca ochricompacta TaxID=376703 RepID=A0AAD4M452_9AGAM|nr:hypothetical protein B0F90DRAFT_1818300 [Multifurca ochricompacta]